MEALGNLIFGFSVALQPGNIAFVFLGVLAGTVIGMLPGLGPMSALALMIPVTFGMEPASGLILMAGVYYGAIFGGSTSAILLNAPGVAATVATSFDGYPLAKKGLAGKALALAAYASFVGGTISVIGLMLVAPLLSRVAVSFGSAEYFALMVLGLSAVVSLSGRSVVRGLIAGVFGIMIAIVGVDRQTGTLRYTGGTLELMQGIDFIVVALGVFALTEVFILLLRGEDAGKAKTRSISSLKLTRQEVKTIASPTLRSSVLGFFVGVLPGAGATIASFLGYSMEKRLAKDSDTFGKGNIKGVVAPEAANNAACGGSFVPLLTLGVPGSGSTAVLLGALLVMGITPGPLMLEQRPDVFWGVIASMYIGNIFLLVLNLPLIPLFAKILDVPRALLVSMVVLFCIIGVYALKFSTFDLYLLTIFGVVGLIMRLNGFPLAPLILGLILGDLMEENMRRALQISGGDWMTFLERPISLVLLLIAAASVLWPLVSGWIKRRSSRQIEADQAGQ
jgi:putative tricarboxylic transport membrane protein